MKENTMKVINDLNNKQSKSALKIGKKDCLAFIAIKAMIMLSIVVNAQNTMTLAQVINSGLANRQNIVAGKFDAAISYLQTKALYQKYWPQVSAEYQYLYNPILQTSILPIGVFNPNYPIDATKSVQFGTKWSQSAGITGTLPLLDLSIQSHINEAKLQEKISALSQEQSEYELAYAIAQTYIDIYLEEAKIQSLIIDTNRTYISYILLQNKFDEKRLLKSDLNKSKINHNNTVQLLSDGIAQLIQDKVYLLYLMGTKEIDNLDFEIDTTFFIEYAITPILKPIDINQLPDLQQLKLQSELVNLQGKSENTKRLPTIGFKGYLGANQFSNTFDPTAANTWFGLSYVGLDIKVPILFGENSRNKIQQLKLQSDQYNLQQEDKSLQYTKDLFTTSIKIENVQSQLKTQEENIALSSESIDIFQLRVKEGQESASNLNLEETSIQFLKANFQTNKKQLWVYWLDYLKASGQLTILWK
jgi:outer membrane protein